jgi:uncharacterized protein (DUF1330 family)
MKHKFALAFVVGIIMGGATIEGLRAQATPPTYAVVDISGITDPEGYKAIHAKSGAAVATFGGKFVVGTEKITAIDGTAPKRFVLIKFDNPENAIAWRDSAAQKEVAAILKATTTSRLFLVEGLN